MPERPVVVEVIAAAALSATVPVERGDDLRAGVAAALAGIEGVRHVVVEQLGDVARGDDALRVEAYARVTFHLDPELANRAEEVARGRLAAAGPVAALKTFDVESGPYRIEAW